MIIFHEGLPGSGKSYEACVKYIIEALKKGRKVFAYVEGLNHEKFAEVTELPLPVVKSLLIQIDREQVNDIYNHVENDALVVIDELQNYWPSGRQKLPQEMIQFITEHRHRGLDILAMGQDLRDVHSMWRRRVSQKTVFLKRDAVGQPHNYTWTTYKAPTPEKFQKISSGKGTYESKYFGLYKSHTDDTDNTADFADSRANIFKTKGFKYGLPAAGIAFVYALYTLVSFFTPEDQATEIQQMASSTQPQQPDLKAKFEAHKGMEPVPKQAAEPEEPPEPPPLDYFDRIAGELRLRLAGYAEMGDMLIVQVDALDGTNRVKESFTSSAIEGFGWTLHIKPYGLLVTKEHKSHIVRPWPLDIYGRVSKAQAEAL